MADLPVFEQFEGSSATDRAVTRISPPIVGAPTGDQNVVFDYQDMSGTVGWPIFEEFGETGLGMTRQLAFGVSTLWLWVNGYDFSTAPEPMAEEMPIEASYLIYDSGEASTYAVLVVEAHDGSDLQPLVSLIYDPSFFGGNIQIVQGGTETWITVPLGFFVKYAVTISEDMQTRVVVTSAGDFEIVDTGWVESDPGWSVARIGANVTNFDGTQYILDNFKVGILDAGRLKVRTPDGWKFANPKSGENDGSGVLKVRTPSGWELAKDGLKVATPEGWKNS